MPSTAFTIHPSKSEQVPRPRLVFHRYGNVRFLAEVWSSGNGLALSRSKTEKEYIARTSESALVELALKK